MGWGPRFQGARQRRRSHPLGFAVLVRIAVASCLLSACVFPTVGAVSGPAPVERPNVVIFFTDDQGYGDVGVFGAREFETPNLDRMAAEGMRMTDFYVAQPVCSASRAALMTGCYSNRVGISGALSPRARRGLHADEVTLAELLQSRGYATGAFGKWHLGHLPEFLPTRHGFDEFYGLPYSNDMWPIHPDLFEFPESTAKRKRGHPDLPLIEGERVVDPLVTPEDQARFTTDFTRRAVDFIERHAREPFFLYLAHPMPHVPLYVSERFAGRSQQGLYGDVMMELDWSLGQVLGALKDEGIDERTLVIFASDNGPWLSYGNHGGSSGGLREGKGTTWEGGVRVPCIVRWPGRVPAGTVCDEPAMTIDILPTVARLAGARLPRRTLDGLDIWPLLAGEPGARSPHEVLLFYYRTNHLQALRAGRWKLVFPHRYRSLTGTPGRDGSPRGYTQASTGLMLFDLENDPGETLDVHTQYPSLVLTLLRAAEAARADLGDEAQERPGSGRRPAGFAGES